MQCIADHRKADDALWVYCGAGQAFLYYDRLLPFTSEFRIGECNRADPREYLRQVDSERGRSRVWVLMAHDSGKFRFDERQLLVDDRDAIGRRPDERFAAAVTQRETR